MAEAVPTLAPGAVLDGRYRLVRALGSGGMGMVFQAVHLRLDRPVAIKVLRPEIASTHEYQIRFEREARAASIIQSPHAVRVFDVATSPEGMPYMVMELLSGTDLGEELAKRGPLPVVEVADWIIQACAALQEAHDNRIVHRDIKPANIFLAETDSGRIAKLLDFGISKFDDPTFQTLTKAVDTLGTPTFMSPEQIRGLPLDARTDIWSLGIVLYRVLSNRWPFGGKNEAAYMAGVLADPPLPFELVRPDLPSELANVIMHALEKRAEDRFASATELAAALALFGSGKTPLVALRTAATPARLPLESLPDATTPEPVQDLPSTVREGDRGSDPNATARTPAGAPEADRALAPTRATNISGHDDDPRWAAAHTLPSGPPPAAITPGAHAIDVLAHGPTLPVAIDTGSRRKQSALLTMAVASVVVVGLGGGGYLYATKSSKSHAANPPATATDTADHAPPAATTTVATGDRPPPASVASAATAPEPTGAPAPPPTTPAAAASSAAPPRTRGPRRDGAGKAAAAPVVSAVTAAPSPVQTPSAAPAASTPGITRNRHE